jgi:voltage-gated potassium channel
MKTTFQKIYAWLEYRRHPIFLVGLLSFFLLPVLIEKIFLIRVHFPIIIIILIISGILLVHASTRRPWIGYALILLLLIFTILWALFEENESLRKIAFVVFFIYFSFLSFYLYKDLIQSKIITPNVITGAFSGYFLIGVLFFFILALLEVFYPDTLSINMHDRNGLDDTLYFSFITLTTIGYGDITPTSQLGQHVAVLEGLFGQFYIAIIMATIVGKFISGKSKKDNESTH